MIMPFARLARLSCKASATASAIAENAAMMPAVEKPSALTTTITSAIYKTTVTIDVYKRQMIHRTYGVFGAVVIHDIQC